MENTEHDQHIKVRHYPKKHVIVIIFREEQLDSYTIEGMKDKLKMTADHYYKNKKIKQIVLSFVNVKRMDSVGMGILLSFWKHVALNSNMNVSICRCSDNVLRVLNLSKLNHIFDISETEESVLNAIDDA